MLCWSLMWFIDSELGRTIAYPSLWEACGDAFWYLKASTQGSFKSIPSQWSLGPVSEVHDVLSNRDLPGLGATILPLVVDQG